ncbi:MAG: acyl-CoA dehydratase activase-related protein [Atribacterota bacterium]|jgi:predicted nucleotide-binding protein (sugar kinase/HSP70/actin superfamily)|nr:acyl-CoA dehydratase activase-related protein [Atribacterota bacterium]MDD5636866.1 acyl-CoA dehydratase activase-related protein [Atribacterota bacterium]
MKQKKIGIPYALYFYEYYPLWKEFLTRLGAEVILSKSTNKNILDLGIRSSLSEVCLPVKAFYGHVLSLADQVDYMLIPRMVCVEKGAFFCPKIIGLPDMVKTSLTSLCPIINPVVDIRKSYGTWKNSLFQVGQLVTENSLAISRAFSASWENFQKNYVANILDPKTLRPGLLNIDTNSARKQLPEIPINIAVVGHDYLINDSYINLNLIEKLKNMKVNVLTPGMVPPNIVKKQLKKLYKPIFWSLSRKVTGAAFYYFENRVEGIIHLTSFECGEDSMVGELIHHQSQQHPGVAYTEFVFDEHTGEAGINTRIEGFLDMIRRKKRNEISFAPSW